MIIFYVIPTYVYILYFCSLNQNMNFFNQFVFARAGLAHTGEPVYLPQGGQHVPGGVDVHPQGGQHVPSVVDVLVPRFCRTQGTYLFYK